MARSLRNRLTSALEKPSPAMTSACSGPISHDGLPGQIEVVRARRGQRTGDGEQDLLAGAAEMVVDVVRAFDAEHRHMALRRIQTQLLVVGRPGIRLVVLGEAERVLGRRPHRGAVERTRRRTADIGEHETDRAPYRRVGPVALAEGVVAPVHVDIPRGGSAHEAGHGARMGGGLQRLQIERGIAHGAHQGDHDRKM